MELISVLVYAQNDGAGLQRTVNGLLADPLYPEIEVLVLDDQSEDGCWEFLTEEPYLSDPRLRLLRADGEYGPDTLRSWGVQEARGSYLAFLWGRHCFAPGWLANLYTAVQRRDFAAAVGPLLVELDEESWSFGERVSYGLDIGRKGVGEDGLVPGFVDGICLMPRELYGNWLPSYLETTSLVGHVFSEEPRPESSEGVELEEIPLISVIMSSHNEGDSLRRTVESVQAQGLDVELLLVDDGSDDGSFDFLQQLPYRGDGRVRSFRFEESVGCVRGRHQGVLMATGELVLFLDAHMAVPENFFTEMVGAWQRAGPLSAIVPHVAILEEETWEIGPPTGQYFAINERLEFVWQESKPPGTLTSVGGGCCVLMARDLYHRVGGFDLNLRRWGSEFTDLILKVYNVGGSCQLEPDVRVGHLFRKVFPYTMTHLDVSYNKLRTAFVHFSDEVFQRYWDLTLEDPGFAEARPWFEESLPELESRREAQRASCRRHPDWFPAMFLPGLMP